MTKKKPQNLRRVRVHFLLKLTADEYKNTARIYKQAGESMSRTVEKELVRHARELKPKITEQELAREQEMQELKP